MDGSEQIADTGGTGYPASTSMLARALILARKFYYTTQLIFHLGLREYGKDKQNNRIN